MNTNKKDMEDEALALAIEMAERKRDADAAHQAERERKRATLDIATQLGVADHLSEARREVERRRKMKDDEAIVLQKSTKNILIVCCFLLTFFTLVFATPLGSFWYFVFCSVTAYFASIKRLDSLKWVISSGLGFAYLLFAENPDTRQKTYLLDMVGLSLSFFTLVILTFLISF